LISNFDFSLFPKVTAVAHLSKKGNWFVARFTWASKEYKKALKTKDQKDAKAALRDVENRIHDLHRGKAQIPSSVDPGDFIVWGNAARPKTNTEVTRPTFGELAKAYLEAGEGFRAESTLATEKIHLNTIGTLLGAAAKLPVTQLRHKDLDQVLRKRMKEVSTTTVKKERQTIVRLFCWAAQQELIDSSPAAGLPAVKAGSDHPPFRTLEEIEEMLEQGDLSDMQVAEIWERLYLTPREIAEILAIVRDRSGNDFAYPMYAIIAYTGIRRGEMMRLRWSDIDFRRKLITARSLKQSRQKRETSREINMHSELEIVIKDYKNRRRTGQFVICKKKSTGPLTKSQANAAFLQPLRGTRWERTMPSGRKRTIIGFHTFRHSFASNLAAAGVDQRIIDRWMGHTTESMRRRYQHLFPQKLAENIRVLSYAPTKEEGEA
jgi:integrase